MELTFLCEGRSVVHMERNLHFFPSGIMLYPYSENAVDNLDAIRVQLFHSPYYLSMVVQSLVDPVEPNVLDYYCKIMCMQLT